MSDGERLVCTFRIAGRLFGIDVLAIRGITADRRYTPIPHTPPAVIGYTNLRGEIILAIDLAQMLGLPVAAAVNPHAQLILLRPSVGEACGLLVDEVYDVAPVSADRVDATRALESSELLEDRPWVVPQALVAGIGMLPQGLVVLLDPAQVLLQLERIRSL